MLLYFGALPEFGRNSTNGCCITNGFTLPVHRWKEHRVISFKAKWIASVTMGLSYGYLLFFRDTSPWILLLTCLVMGYGLWFILTKPSHMPGNTHIES